MQMFFKQPVSNKLSAIILALVFLATTGLGWLGSQDYLPQICVSFPKLPRISLPGIFLPPQMGFSREVKKFVSLEDFKDYLQKGTINLGYGSGFGGLQITALRERALAPTAKDVTPERVSETNVQVSGIDEPDIVKTDGKEIYFSREEYWGWRGGLTPMVKIADEFYPEYQAQTKLIKAFPPEDLALDSKIEKSGNLLLANNILVVFSNQEILGYDVKDPKTPQKKWEIKLEDNSSLVGARLKDNKIYLVTRSFIDEARPCPIQPMSVDGKSLEVRCIDIYHPIVPIPADITFVASILDPISGKVEKTVSFVGSSSDSILFVSSEAIYTTYSYYEDFSKFFLGFINEKARDLFPASVREKMEKLAGYDISQQSKLTEIQQIMEKYQNSLKGDERLKLENEVTNRMSEYQKEHKRDLEKTGIVKISLENLNIMASGTVPGKPLNQFSLDEYQGYLRIATTIGSNWWGGFGMGFGTTESANDVYVLDGELKIKGSVKDLGLTERIYSARFIEDKGYLVTFRQTDPFYVLDLSNPSAPQLKGELKIPGFSSYLHPVTKDLILGVGQENWQVNPVRNNPSEAEILPSAPRISNGVKLSLFDVSNPKNPQEVAKYILDDSWTEVSNNHHAFLMDQKHGIFFLPGSKGGYIFSYKNNQLSMVKAIAGVSAKRAIYLDDYLYIISDSKITVLSELDWTVVKELDL